MPEQVGKPANDREPESKTLFAATRRLDLVKFLEYGFLLVLADADSRIFDLDVASAIALKTTHGYFAFICVTDRVTDEILNNLTQQIGV